MAPDDFDENGSFPQQVRSLAARAFPVADAIGEKAPKCWDGVWLAAESLYDFGTCRHSCPGKTEDHSIRMLVGRIANETLGVLDCLERGYYDLALIGCRVICEQHNLLALLMRDDTALDTFKRSDHAELLEELSPRKVIKKLRGLGADDAIVQEVDKLHKELSKRAIHPALEQLAITHTPGLAIVGPIWEPAGFLVGLNELALVAAATLYTLALHSAFEGEAKHHASDALNCIADGLGGMRVYDFPEELRQQLPADRWIS